MEKLDLDIPNTLKDFFVEGNPNIRIKDMNLLFSDLELETLIDGDFNEVLADYVLYDEYMRSILAQRCYQGRKYIDIRDLIRRYHVPRGFLC